MPRLRTLIPALACLIVAPAAHASVVAVAGDTGAASAGSAAVATLIDNWRPDAVVLAGDNYYAGVGAAPGARYDASIGRYWCGYLAGAPGGTFCPTGGTSPVNRLWPVTGNHDYSDAGIAEYDAYFPTGSATRHYRTTVGEIDLFMLDSEAMRGSAASLAAQGAWLQASLATSAARWQVVVLHHPPYVTSVRGASESLRLPYRDWGADLVVAAHDHYYERLAVDNLTYVVTGTGGASLSAFPATPVAESVTHHAGAHGALRLAGSASGLAGSYVTTDGTTRDTFLIATPPTASDAAPALTTSPTAAVLGARGDVRISRAGRLRIRLDNPGAAATARLALTIRDRAGHIRVRAVRTVTAAQNGGWVSITLGRRAARMLARTVQVRAAISAPGRTSGRHADWVRVR